MDHQAFAQLLGSYGEFVGAIAVVITLAYIGVQVRQTKKMVTSSLRESRNNGTRELFLAMATSDDLAKAWTEAENEMPGEPFMKQRTIVEEQGGVGSSDAQRVMAYAIALFFHYRTMFYAELGEADRHSLNTNIKRYFSNGIGALMINQYPNDEFVKHAQTVLEEGSA